MDFEKLFKNVFTASNFRNFTSGFPKYLAAIAKDPLGRKVSSPTNLNVAPAEEIATAVVVLMVASAAAGVLSGSFLLAITQALMVPMYAAAGTLLAFVLLLMLGFEGSLAKFVSMVVQDIPVVCACILATPVLMKATAWNLGIGLIAGLLLTGIGLVLSYRFLKICGIAKSKIALVVAILALAQMSTVWVAVRTLSEIEGVQMSLGKILEADLSKFEE